MSGDKVYRGIKEREGVVDGLNKRRTYNPGDILYDTKSKCWLVLT